METLAKRKIRRRRCPHCHGAVWSDGSGHCLRCGSVTPPDEWAKVTEELPLQPEEENGGHCLECGAKVEIRPPSKLVSQTLGAGAFLVCFVFVLWLSFGPDPVPFFLALMYVTNLALVLGFARSRYGRGLLSTVVVACPACDRVRVVGDRDGELQRRLRRSRRAIDLVYRPLFAAVLFLGAVTAVRLFRGHPLVSPTNAAFLFVLVFFAWLRPIRKTLCPPPIPWWKLPLWWAER
jgi:hypothetical protein